MIRDVTGLNEARDGTRPDTYALVGLQKLAALSSNTATRHILDAGLSITQRLCTALSSRVADLIEYSDFREEFVNQVGKFNVGILEEISQLYLSDFGIFIEVAPDEEQEKLLEQNVQMAFLSKEDINLEDAIDIREIKNIKLANQMLKVRRKAKQDQEQQNCSSATASSNKSAVSANGSTNCKCKNYKWRLNQLCKLSKQKQTIV